MKNHMAAGWFYSARQIKHYLLTRGSSLVGPRSAAATRTRTRASPRRALAALDRHQWLMFGAGFLAWTWDAFDFFTVALTATETAAAFGVRVADVSWGITATLMLRSAGAVVFGALADRHGRRAPMLAALALLVVLELASGFARDLRAFLAVRALYGVAMGGLFGPAAATALEDLPYEARGLLSGLFEQGYAVGYLLAAVFYRALVPTTSYGWRSLFWFGAGPPVLIIVYRFCLPETNAFLIMKAEREAAAVAAAGDQQQTAQGLRAWLREVRDALKANWFLFVYMVFLMTGFNSTSHGSQDLYPTFLKSQAELDASWVTIISVVGQIGALLGGTTLGYASTILGRRATMMAACAAGGAVLPAYVLPRGGGRLAAGAFFLQFMVGGAWGPVPVHLTELSPAALRATAVGLTYQLGNLASSASATIQAVVGERFFALGDDEGAAAAAAGRYDYAKVIGIFMGAVWVYDLVLLFVGPEMSEAERDEMAAEARELEELRRSGMSLAEIGAERARLARDKETVAAPSAEGEKRREEKPVDIEHGEAQRQPEGDVAGRVSSD